jgi:hypothetical protein
MTKVVRKQLLITAEQNCKLEARAAATGVPEAELIRAGIDRQLEGDREKTDWRSLAAGLSSSWAERDGLDGNEMREIRRGRNRRDQIMGRNRSSGHRQAKA